MKNLKTMILLSIGFFMMSNYIFAVDLKGKIMKVSSGQIEIFMNVGEHSLKPGEKIELSYMAGVLEMHIGVFEIVKTKQSTVYASATSMDTSPSEGMQVSIFRLGKTILKEPDPGAMLPPSEDPRFLPENTGGNKMPLVPEYNADLIFGEVVEITGKDIRIKLTSPGEVMIGYSAEVFYETSSGTKLPVGIWTVTRVNDREVFASAVKSEVKPRQGMKAEILPPKDEKKDKPRIPKASPKESKENKVLNPKTAQNKSDLEIKAEGGDPEAQDRLGWNYQIGIGVPQDYKRAFYWYKKAADQNYPNAQNNVGWFYEKGFYVNEDLTQAVAWYEKSANQGYAIAQNNLGRNYQWGRGLTRDYQKAVYWYKQAAEKGYPDGQTNMGWMYQNGLGVEKDLARAAFWYEKAADQGHSTAQNNLGSMYNNGAGVIKDTTQALYWYLKAANQGNSMAQNNLGALYLRGDGIPHDREKAVLWLKKAAENGNQTALEILKEIGETR